MFTRPRDRVIITLYDSVCLVMLHMFISFVFLLAKCLQRDQCHQSSGIAALLISKGRAELNSKLCFWFWFFFFHRKKKCAGSLSHFFWASLGEIFQAVFIYRGIVALLMYLCVESTADLFAFQQNWRTSFKEKIWPFCHIFTFFFSSCFLFCIQIFILKVEAESQIINKGALNSI